MHTRRTRRSAAAVLVALALTTALATSGTDASAATVAAPAAMTAAATPGTDGLIAYSCLGYAGTAGRDGWVTSTPAGPVGFAKWPWGSYDGGVNWSADGTEMVHQARFSDALAGHSSLHTVFGSEADAGYPMQGTNFTNVAGLADSEATFAPDGLDIVFTRTFGATKRLEMIDAAGQETPFELPQPDGSNSQPTFVANGDLAFVNVADTGPNAGVPWVWYLATWSDTPVPLQPGTHPKVAPDASSIAFVSGNQLFTMVNGANVTAAGPSSYPGAIKDFAWSPDGTQFLLGLAVGGGAVYTAPIAAGSALTAVPASPCTTRANQVSWQSVPTTPDQVVRVWGSTRENTSVAVSRAEYPADHTADAIVLADSYHFPDALSGAALAAGMHGPLLLTPGSQSTVLPAVMAEIKRVLSPANTQVYVLGGTGSVSQGIADDLAANGLTVTRLGGANRYATSLAIAGALSGGIWPAQIFLATGTDFPDGLSAGAAAASYWGAGGGGGVVLLTNGPHLTPDIAQYIADALANATPSHPVTVTTVGGLADKAFPGTPSDPKISCVGADRYATSACVALVHFGASATVAAATGTSFPDALSGGAFAGAIGAPLLLLPPSLLTGNEVPWLLNATSGAISTAYVFGGTGVVTSTQMAQLGAIIGLDTAYPQVTPTSALSAAARVMSQVRRPTGPAWAPKSPESPESPTTPGTVADRTARSLRVYHP